MNIRKKFYLVLFVLFLICSACKQNQVKLSGRFENAERRFLLLSKITESNEIAFLDTVLLLNGSFSHTVTEDEIGIYLLEYDHSTILTFIAQSGDRMVFTGDARDLDKTYDVQGNQETQLFLETRRRLNLFYDKTKEWAAIFERHKYADNSDAVTDYLDSLYNQEFETHKEYLTHFIRENKGKLATLPAFYQKIGKIAFFDRQKDRALLQEIYDGLSQTYPNSIYVKDLQEKLEEDFFND